MKTLALTLALLISGITFGQSSITGKPVVEKVTESSSKATWFHANGSVREVGYFLNGQKHGTWISYDESGNKVMEANYNNGVKDGNFSAWFSNGSIHYHIVYSDGKRVLATEWDSQGQLIAGTQSK